MSLFSLKWIKEELNLFFSLAHKHHLVKKHNNYRMILGGDLDLICIMDNQQGPAIQHMELCAMLCGSLDGRGVWGRVDTCICMAEALRYSPETTTTLLICHTPTQN